MVALIRSPSRSYTDPWTGQLFGEGGLEGKLHPNPPAKIGGVAGGVIMSKLGNETAKYAENHPLSQFYLFLLKGSTRPCYMETTVSSILSDEEIAHLTDCKGIP
jgi:hypothetical protein